MGDTKIKLGTILKGLLEDTVGIKDIDTIIIKEGNLEANIIIRDCIKDLLNDHSFTSYANPYTYDKNKKELTFYETDKIINTIMWRMNNNKWI